MKKVLPVLILIAISVYLTPLYPVYAQTTATNSAKTPSRAILEARMNLKDKIASRTAALKERLSKFKDRVKAERAERVNNLLAKINEHKIAAFRRHHERLSNLLSKIDERVNEAEVNGKDMTSANAKISEAREALDEAKTAIDDQANKDYTLTVKDETTVKADAKSTREILHTDLKKIHDLFVTARKALAEAVSTAASTMKGAGTSNGQ